MSNISTAPNDGEDYLEAAFQTEVPVHITARRREFFPWHRERKQYIREYQWNFETDNLIRRYFGGFPSESVGAPSQSGAAAPLPQTLKCLVLPGEDLLDVRALSKRMRSIGGCVIKYLGFNCSHGSSHLGSRIHIATNEVNSLSNVANTSEVLHDRIEMLGNTDSVAYRRMKEVGPYHVVNLDLCESIFPVRSADPTDYYKALKSLIQFQCGHCVHPWLLFVTTQVDPQKRDNDKLGRLAQAVRDNCVGSGQFASALEALLAQKIFDEKVSGLAISDLSDEEIFRFFGVAFGKWLLKLVSDCVPPWSIRLLKSYRYSIEDGKIEMASYAFRFQRTSPPPLNDRSGLSGEADPAPPIFDEKACALQFVEAVGKIRDVDQLLTQSQTLKTEVIESSASLLEEAGYDKKAYYDFLAQFSTEKKALDAAPQMTIQP